MNRTTDATNLNQSIQKLEKWIEDHNYKGYEAFDGLSSPLYKFARGNLLAERILQQAVRQSPINLRPLLGVKPLDSTKGRGYIAWGYIRRYQETHDDRFKRKAEECLQWLTENKSHFHEEYSWGNHFEYSSRGGRLPKHQPTIVWTSLIGQVFLDAFELFEDEMYLDVAKGICKWILKLEREKTAEGHCISYVSFAQSSIHNSNMLGAAMLARSSKYFDKDEMLPIAHDAMAYSCADQHHDGAWYYGRAKKYHWIDNFHTGYNLDSLKCYNDHSGDTTFVENLNKGYQYFKDTFFEASGRPKYYHNRAYPIDIQCASQAIDTLVYFSDTDPTAIDLARKVADWTIANMQDMSGYYYYRILPTIKVKIPMIHWGQATMYKSLANLIYVS